MSGRDSNRAQPLLSIMVQIVEVSFKGNRRDFFAHSDDAADAALDDFVVVEADRGEDLGRVTAFGSIARVRCPYREDECAPARQVLRRAKPAEVRQADSLRQDELRVVRVVRDKVKDFGLKMRVSDVEWQFDRNKLTIFFTAEQRVDFREIVRDLARTFRTRIEMRQIGVRDEAALLGGVGRCGLGLCCSSWLRNLKPVSLQLAKNQRLSLNPSQISGCCGRLMCCLNNEHEIYLQARRKFPREGKAIQTRLGTEHVEKIDIWNERVVLKGPEGELRTVDLSELKTEVAAVRSKRHKPGKNKPRSGGG